ncbi:endo-1,4-beta-xylanase [Natrinema salaciae]|uniref:endo-1,4-beta-xylanase n=1 Tax=Natrinema salaciae TaxID=1186196 RepID=A0A1H9IGC3_9EURY|nr:endo-1,4-beta-xylanase [Natrinema salaciae]SEQ73577.1 Endo-1,4-beta-xylanase, GH35 family [Natrinema salaciae]
MIDEPTENDSESVDAPGRTIGRRPVLGSLAALGAGHAVASATAQSWSGVDDPYYATLADELAAHGLPQGEFCYGSGEAEAMAAYDVIGDVEAAEIQAPADLPFNEAMRLEVGADVSNPWDAILNGTVEDRGVAAGDVLLGVVYLREGPASDTDGLVQYTAKDGDNLETNEVVNAATPSLPREWRRFYFQIEFDYASDPGDWWTELFLGYGSQTVDVGGLALIHFGQSVETDALPGSGVEFGYEGRTEGAAWREAARERIDEIRRAPLTVTVTDEDGDPIPDADVAVEMRDHEFGFGSAIAVDELTANERYQDVFLENFNEAVTENGLKRGAWEGEFGSSLGPENTEAAIDWLNRHDVPTRGHTLLWGTYDAMGVDDTRPESEIVAAIEETIRERAAAMEGRLLEWDMHNHPVMFSEITDDLGRESVVDWWSAATDEDPTAPMWVNEGRVISARNGNRDPYREYIEWLDGTAVDVDGIGFMGHFDVDYLRPPAELLEIFDEFAAFDVPLKITELDITLKDPNDEDQIAVRRDYMRDLLIAAYSHEALESVLHWGFWANRHWRPAAALYDEDWVLRAHGEAYRELVFEEWWTEESGTTDADGTYATEPYLGDHEVTVTVGESETTETVSLTDPDDAVDLTVEIGDPASDTIQVGEYEARDPDGDALYDDVDGDGETTHADVDAFYEHLDSEGVQDNPDAFDFDGNDRIGFADVLDLLRRI